MESGQLIWARSQPHWDLGTQAVTWQSGRADGTDLRRQTGTKTQIFTDSPLRLEIQAFWRAQETAENSRLSQKAKDFRRKPLEKQIGSVTLKQGGFPIWTCPSFFVLFRDFPDFFSGIFPICPFPLFRSFKSTYEEQSPKGPRHNPDLFPKNVGNPPGLETPRFSFPHLKHARNKNLVEAAILNRVLDRAWTLNRRGPLSCPFRAQKAWWCLACARLGLGIWVVVGFLACFPKMLRFECRDFEIPRPRTLWFFPRFSGDWSAELAAKLMICTVQFENTATFLRLRFFWTLISLLEWNICVCAATNPTFEKRFEYLLTLKDDV